MSDNFVVIYNNAGAGRLYTKSFLNFAAIIFGGIIYILKNHLSLHDVEIIDKVIIISSTTIVITKPHNNFSTFVRTQVYNFPLFFNSIRKDKFRKYLSYI